MAGRFRSAITAVIACTEIEEEEAEVAVAEQQEEADQAAWAFEQQEEADEAAWAFEQQEEVELEEETVVASGKQELEEEKEQQEEVEVEKEKEEPREEVGVAVASEKRPNPSCDRPVPEPAIDTDKLCYEIFSMLESKFLFGYDDDDVDHGRRPRSHTVSPSLASGTSVRNQRGKVCILSLDGGAGMRSVLMAGALAHLEQALRTSSGDPEANICDFFDVATGAGVGGIFAAMLFATRDGLCPIYGSHDTFRFLADHGHRFFLGSFGSQSDGERGCWCRCKNKIKASRRSKTGTSQGHSSRFFRCLRQHRANQQPAPCTASASGRSSRVCPKCGLNIEGGCMWGCSCGSGDVGGKLCSGSPAEAVLAVTRGLEVAVKETFGESLTLRDTLKPLLIPCHDMLTSAPFLFSRADAMESCSYDFRLWEVCRATWAEPGHFEPAQVSSLDGATRCLAVDGGLASCNPTAAAITHVLHNKQEFPFVRGVEDLMVLSLGAGGARPGVPSEAATSGRGVRRGRGKKVHVWKVGPVARIATDGVSEMVDQAVGMAFSNCRNNSSYVRIQASASKPANNSVTDADSDPSPQNVDALLRSTGEMLRERNVESIMFGGLKRVGEQSNMEMLDWFAKELVTEHRRRSARIAPTVAFKQPFAPPTSPNSSSNQSTLTSGCGNIFGST